MELNEFANLLEAAGKKIKEQVVIPPASDGKLIKDAILNVSKYGVKALQTSLALTADGIIGSLTKAALEKISVDDLLVNLSNYTSDGTGLSFATLKVEYKSLYARMKINAEHVDEVVKIVKNIKANFSRYDDIALQTRVSPNIIGIIHSLESNLSFSRHFHNGDLLSSRTVNVPAGRPVAGNPPFTWEESALDAITYYGLDKWGDWSPEGIAYILEKYNGWGYRLYHPQVKSPYLWSFTSIYTSGKYSSDGTFNPNLVSTQCGGMALLKGLTE